MPIIAISSPYYIEEAWCNECENYVPVYPCCVLEQSRYGDYILATACCYKHSLLFWERALFRSGDPTHYPVSVKPQPGISHKMTNDFEGPLWQ